MMELVNEEECVGEGSENVDEVKEVPIATADEPISTGTVCQADTNDLKISWAAAMLNVKTHLNEISAEASRRRTAWSVNIESMSDLCTNGLGKSILSLQNSTDDAQEKLKIRNMMYSIIGPAGLRCAEIVESLRSLESHLVMQSELTKCELNHLQQLLNPKNKEQPTFTARISRFLPPFNMCLRPSGDNFQHDKSLLSFRIPMPGFGGTATPGLAIEGNSSMKQDQEVEVAVEAMAVEDAKAPPLEAMSEIQRIREIGDALLKELDFYNNSAKSLEEIRSGNLNLEFHNFVMALHNVTEVERQVVSTNVSYFLDEYKSSIRNVRLYRIVASGEWETIMGIWKSL